MNPLPPNADELVSAYVDGEAAPDEVATVESNAELMARVEAMRSVSAQVANPTTPPPAEKEAHLAAALGAFDELFAPTKADQDQHDAPAAAAKSNVASLEAARERRRPRRFNVGVIAAALAAVLLIVGLSVLGSGRTDDVASDTMTEAASMAADSGSSDDAADAVEEAMEDEEEAMDDEEAMGDADSGRTSALSEVDTAEAEAPAAAQAPAPTALPAPVADEDAMDEEAMEEEAVDETEDAAQDTTAGGVDSDTTSEPDLRLDPQRFFLGEYDDIDNLKSELGFLSRQDLEQRQTDIGQGLFDQCQAEIPELAAAPTNTLFGEAFVGREPRELHALIDDDGTMQIYVVDPGDCSVAGIYS